jgi:hypothetical protein
VNYATLTERLQDTLEVGFTADQLAMFTIQAEKNVYNSVEVPSQRKILSSALTADGRTLTLPNDFIWADSLEVNDGSGQRSYLIQKEYSFMREAYPSDTATGLPKYYALLEADEFVFGPIPDQNYAIELTYGYYPESISTAVTTWLGDNFGEVLLNAAVVEAGKFNKLEQDVMKMYVDLYALSLEGMKNVLEGKRKADDYRAGEVRRLIR